MTRPYKRGPLCSHCDNERLPYHPYCRECKRAADRAWRAARSSLVRTAQKISRGLSGLKNRRSVAADIPRGIFGGEAVKV